LRGVVKRDDVALQSALAQLEDAELLFRTGTAQDVRYSFKHALVQDTAYESLLKSRRQIIHQHIAEILRDKFPAVAAAEPELVARHLTHAGLNEPAIEWWGKAGDLALRRSAFKEAIAHFAKAIEMADEAATRQASSAVSSTERLRLQTAYGQALLWAHGHAAQRTKSAFARARELASRVENAIDRFSAYYGLWVGNYTRGEIGPAREMAELFLREIEAQPSLPQACVGHRIFGTTCWYLGDFAGAHHHLEKALSLYDRAAHGDFANRFGQDIAVSAEYFDALTLYPLGHVEQALARADQALADAQLTAHVPTFMQLYFWRWFLGAVRRDADSAAADAQAASALVLSTTYERSPATRPSLEAG
jgi:tetratricopeptide (TPR) repeat protein